MDGDLSSGGVGALFMLATLLGILGALSFFFNRCANQFGRRGFSGSRGAAEAGAGQGQAQAQGGGLLAFWRALQGVVGGRLGLGDAAIAALPLAELAREAECAVCLGELAAGESARLLPPCGHTFHVDCVDTWLRSRATCPLCRQAVVVDVSAMPRGNVQVDAPQPTAPAPGPILLPQAGGRAPLAGARNGGGEGSHSLLLVVD